MNEPTTWSYLDSYEGSVYWSMWRRWNFWMGWRLEWRREPAFGMGLKC